MIQLFSSKVDYRPLLRRGNSVDLRSEVGTLWISTSAVLDPKDDPRSPFCQTTPSTKNSQRQEITSCFEDLGRSLKIRSFDLRAFEVTISWPMMPMLVDHGWPTCFTPPQRFSTYANGQFLRRLERLCHHEVLMNPTRFKSFHPCLTWVISVIFMLQSFLTCHYRSYLHLFIRSFVRSFLHSFIPSFLHSFIPSFIHSCIHAFIRSFVRSFVHSFIHLYSILYYIIFVILYYIIYHYIILYYIILVYFKLYFDILCIVLYCILLLLYYITLYYILYIYIYSRSTSNFLVEVEQTYVYTCLYILALHLRVHFPEIYLLCPPSQDLNRELRGCGLRTLKTRGRIDFHA